MIIEIILVVAIACVATGLLKLNDRVSKIGKSQQAPQIVSAQPLELDLASIPDEDWQRVRGDQGAIADYLRDRQIAARPKTDVNAAERKVLQKSLESWVKTLETFHTEYRWRMEQGGDASRHLKKIQQADEEIDKLQKKIRELG